MRCTQSVSPTVLRVRGYRFYFFSREEPRRHVHVHHADGEAKIWLEPNIAVARNLGLSATQLGEVVRIVQEHEDEINKAWQRHFGG